jgi:predicted PurR-regulated permease PerM
VGAVAVIWYVIVNQVENYILIPRLYRRTMQLHPLLVLIAFMVGGQLFGVMVRFCLYASM